MRYHLKFMYHSTLAWVSRYILDFDTCYYMYKMQIIGLLVHILMHS